MGELVSVSFNKKHVQVVSFCMPLYYKEEVIYWFLYDMVDLRPTVQFECFNVECCIYLEMMVGNDEVTY